MLTVLHQHLQQHISTRHQVATLALFSTLMLNKDGRAVQTAALPSLFCALSCKTMSPGCTIRFSWVLCDVIAVSQHSAAASTRLPFSLFCFCCHRAVRGRTPRDRISLYVYLSALLDGTGLEKRTRNRKCERRNQKCTWVTETVFDQLSVWTSSN